MGGIHYYYNLLKLVYYLECPPALPASYWYLWRRLLRKHFRSLKTSDCEKELVVSFVLGAPQAHRHRLTCMLQRRTMINNRTYRRGKVTFWRRNLYCMLFRYCLLNCENVTCLVLIKVVIMDENWSYLGILYVKAYILYFLYIRFSNCRTVCFCSNIHFFVKIIVYNICCDENLYIIQWYINI